MFRSDLLSKKKALVTGGGSGLGRSISKRYLELGAEVVICGRRSDVLQATSDELRESTGGKISFIPCNIRDPEAVIAMIDQIYSDGPLDILVNNAAANFIARTEQLSHRAVNAILETVLHGAFYCTTTVGKRWIESGRKGTVLSVVTTPAFTGAAFTASSAAAKAGVLAMTRSLAVEWGPKGIRLNAVAPGLFPTPGAWDRLYPPGSQTEPQELSIPLRRFGDHLELANLFSYLASDEAGYITGDCVVIDGGRWMQGVGGPSLRAMQDWTDEKWAELR